MNKLAIVTKNPQTYFVKRLIEEVGHSALLFNPWQDTLFPEADQFLVRTTGVYGSDLDLLMLQSLDVNQVINPLLALRRFRSKTSQYLWFEENNFPVAPWISLKNVELVTVEKFFRLFPDAIVKPNYGQGGWGVQSLKWDNFKSWWKKKAGIDEDYLLQAHVKGATELRYFFIANEFSFVLERTAKTGVAANYSASGTAIVSSLPAGFQSLIDQLIHLSGAQYGALDLLIEGNQLTILELNSVPGIEQLETLSGLNIIRKLLSAKFFCQIF